MPGDGWMVQALEDVRAQGLYRSPDARLVQGRQGRTVMVGGKELRSFASNDYLGLAGDPAVIQASRNALERFGNGSGASRLITGNVATHKELEGALRRFMGAEGVVLFGNGMLANMGTISTLVGPGDAVFSDALNHASLIDGCRLSRASTHVYRHVDLAHLESLLHLHKAPRRLIVTDAVFSMDGDLAPLKALVDLAERHDAMVLVDEAHALGTLGDGSGLCASLGVAQRVTARMATLGKALGSYGAFVAGSSTLTELLYNRARSIIFSTSLPPAASASAMAALGCLAEGSGMRQLAALQTTMMQELGRHGLLRFLPEQLQSLPMMPTPIVPILLGDNLVCLQVAQRLQEAGFLVVAIRPPTVPEGTARLRITLNALHTQEDVAALVKTLAQELKGIAAPQQGATVP